MASQNSIPSSNATEVIRSFEGVPQVYQEFFKPYLSRGDEFPYTVLTPTYKVPGDTITGKLICVIDHAFYVLEERENRLTKVCFPIDEINYVEVVHLPTDLLVKINGLTNLGLPATSVFGCNKSIDNILVPIFQRIRLRIVALNEKAPSRHMEKLDRWNDLNTQVIDLARHCLMPGETVIESILQPEIRPSIFSFDRAIRGGKCPTHICILTDKELVLIREDRSVSRKDPCGSVCNFVPLNKINALNLSRESDHFLTASIRVLNGEVFESLFDVSLENEVKQFLDLTRELMPKERSYIRD